MQLADRATARFEVDSALPSIRGARATSPPSSRTTDRRFADEHDVAAVV